MGSRLGYTYDYALSLGDLSEMKSMMMSEKPGKRKRDRPIVLEVRTVFTIFWRRTRKGGHREIIAEELFDICNLYESDEGYKFYYCGYRFAEYWMTYDEVVKLGEDVFSFVKEIGGQHASLTRIPVYVDFEVCTVQQEGESYASVMERAIGPSKLDPLYMDINQSTWTNPVSYEVKDFVFLLPRTRVENLDQGSAIMPTSCHLCSKGPSVGDRIAKLKCDCQFHSPCIARWLEQNHCCPICLHPQFSKYFLMFL